MKKNIYSLTINFLTILVVFMGQSCRKDKLPTISTSSITNTTPTNADCGGTISSDGGAAIIERGVCWSTNQNPTIADNKTLDGAGSGNYTSYLTGLTKNKTYYVRAYATNKVGTNYGNQVSFIADFPNCGTITDIDGNVYHSVTIGAQCWMKENLKVKHFRNGDLINTTNDALNISSEVAPTYQFAYGGDENNVSIYGRLYTWYTITDSRNVCPIGWHIPTEAEWDILIASTGGRQYAANYLKEEGSIHWTTTLNISGTDSYGFCALPGGYHGVNENVFLSEYLGTAGYWWTSTEDSSNNNDEVRYKSIFDASSQVFGNSAPKFDSYSVRCIKD